MKRRVHYCYALQTPGGGPRTREPREVNRKLKQEKQALLDARHADQQRSAALYEKAHLECAALRGTMLGVRRASRRGVEFLWAGWLCSRKFDCV